MDKLIDTIFSNKTVVVITGAGISTLSGIPDFRGNNGLYTKNDNVEYKLSYSYFIENPEGFYNFYINNMIMNDVKPNIIHKTLTILEEKGYISGIITQNIDNLHQLAGSKNVIDIHGNGDEFYCIKCKEKFSSLYYINKGFKCSKCNGIIRPNIVLYEERLDARKMYLAYEAINNADAVIVLGSSLIVSTISNLLRDYVKDESKLLYIVNNKSTPFDKYAITYKEDLGNVFKKIKIKLD